jgi:hypothetical protein
VSALHPVTTVKLGLTLAVLGLLWLLAIATRGFIPILDHANLAFHEAGHLVFRVFGQVASLYGGTLLQLVMPAVALVALAARGNTAGAVVCGGWLSENLFYVARYMADAREQVLPLAGGGEHDWEHIFTRWGALARDVKIAAVTRAIGHAGFIVCIAWIAWRWWRDRDAELPPPD